LLAEQAEQAPAQADSQQTPSTQEALEHWLAAVHVAPFACGGTQWPSEAQNVPVAQSAFERQVVLHEVGPQR
jgi:hypothetical protein